MSESSSGNHRPSANSLFRSAFFALLGAVVVTALFIIPAEYGVDPTGVGTRLGLTAGGKTIALERALTDFGAEESFAMASARLEEHYGMEVGRTSILRGGGPGKGSRVVRR